MTGRNKTHTPSNQLVRRLVKTYLRPYFRMLAVAMGFMLMAAAMTALFASLMEPVMDKVLVQQHQNLIIPLGLGILVCFVVSGMCTYAHTILMNKIGQGIVSDIQKDLFARFMTADLVFFQRNPSGQLLSRIVNDVAMMRAAVADSLTGIGRSFVTLVFLSGVMLFQDWKLTLIALIVFPVAGGFLTYVGRRLRRLSGNIQHEIASLSDQLSQIFQGIRQVKAYGMESHENIRAHAAIDRVRRLLIKSVRVGTLSVPVNEMLVGLAIFAIIVYGGYEITDGKMTVGSLISFITAFALAFEPIRRLAKLNNTLQMGLGCADRVFEMMDIQPAIMNRPGAVSLQSKNPEIRFEDVSFYYEGAEGPALDHFSLVIPAGKVTALVGPSGGGKSTVMNLIPRFYDVTSGAVLVDGKDVRDLTIESLRGGMALVSQDISIFDESARANIAYGRAEGASDDDIVAAARAAEADQFIRGMPHGYDTSLGENGVKLSGGQRQRIAIARAILRNAPILLLDEATSALDTESEQAIQKSFAELQKGRTTLVIAHRLSTVLNADQIVVLDHGKIVEQGRHDDLIARQGLYARMYQAGLKE
jgi:subfamily B ATP-binding cassette protein MsbA